MGESSESTKQVVANSGQASASAPTTAIPSKEAASTGTQNDVEDIFGPSAYEDGDDDETEEEKAANAARKARMEKARKLKEEKDAKEGKKAKEKAPKRSLIVLEVKPWEADCDLEA
eukprot:gene4534-5764_t